MKEQNNTVQYNRAKTWQLVAFPFNNTATNCFMLLMMYVSYVATGPIGLSVMFISTFLTGMRIFDAFTDPIIGFLIDKTKTKIGKFRPMIIIGYVLMIVSLTVMYFVAPGAAESMRVPLFIISYVLYIIGYTFQTACTKSGQTCLTNDPAQRPIFARCDGIYNSLLFALGAIFVSNYLTPKYGGLTTEAMQEFALIIFLVSGIFTILAVAALWTKDVPENWGIGEKGTKVGFKDYWSVLKGNRAIQMLVVAASTDKIAGSTASNSAIMVMLFGIVMGNFGLSGQLSLITMIPTILIILWGTGVARKKGSKKAMIIFTYACMITYFATFLLLWLGDPTQISMSNMGFMTIAFVVLHCLGKGFVGVSGNIVIPMIADCSDYETYLTGRYVPGMMGTLFSFVDKIVSSFSTTIVGVLVATVGYTATMPQPNDPYTPAIFWICMFTYIGLPMLGWICNLVAMKFYPLDAEKMEEVQAKISKIKSEAV